MPYKQGRTTSIGVNVSANASLGADRSNTGEIDSRKPEYDLNCQEDEDMDIPEILEEIIEILLSGLRDTVCLEVDIQLWTWIFYGLLS